MHDIQNIIQAGYEKLREATCTYTNGFYLYHFAAKSM